MSKTDWINKVIKKHNAGVKKGWSDAARAAALEARRRHGKAVKAFDKAYTKKENEYWARKNQQIKATHAKEMYRNDLNSFMVQHKMERLKRLDGRYDVGYTSPAGKRMTMSVKDAKVLMLSQSKRLGLTKLRDKWTINGNRRVQRHLLIK